MTGLQVKRLYFFLCLTIFISLHCKGTHLSGTELTYQHSNGNAYTVTYKIYRDCSGTPAPLSANLLVKSETCNQFFQVMLNRNSGSGNEITPTCPGVTTCSGGSVSGIQEFIYSGLVIFPQACTDWKLSVSDCCRNESISNLVAPSTLSVYTEAFLNNSIGTNSSPSFNILPITNLCTNQLVRLNPGITESEGDSVVILLGSALSGENLPVQYATGFTYSQPISSSIPISLNSASGDLSLVPNRSETDVLHFMVKEFRNGILIGQVMRDVQVVIQNCSNTLPLLSGVNNTTDYSMHSCAGSTLSFFVQSSDADPDQSVNITAFSAITNLVISPGNQSRPQLHIEWTPASSEVRIAPYTIFLTIRDDACPWNGVQTFTYLIYVHPAITFDVVTTPASCAAVSNGSASVISSDPVFRYQWSVPGDSQSFRNNLNSGNHYVIVTNEFGCSSERTFTITNEYVPAISIGAITPSNCPDQASGAAEIASVNALYPYTIVWTNGNSGNRIENVYPGNYAVTMTDANGCSAIDSVTIPFLHESPPADIAGSETYCTGTSTDLKAVGGVYFEWNTGNSQSDITVNAPGLYSVIVTDEFGCPSTAAKTISEQDCPEDPFVYFHSIGDDHTLHYSNLTVSKLQVFNMAGQSVRNEESIEGSGSIGITGLPKGIYLLYIRMIDKEIVLKVAL
jgi:hypothetical protein